LSKPTSLKKLVQLAVEIRRDKGFRTDWDNFAEKCMLTVTELSEAVEADREGNREHVAEELADTAIRLFDLCGSLGIDLEKEILNKMERNKKRPQRHGKVY
jgi:NTP pyrophosphatase (non-canonical NTP hydrolase)